MNNDKRFTDAEIQAIYRVMAERRDMRHFLPDPVDEAVLQRLFNAAHLAPSVGFMQPWRFIRITDSALRQAIHRLVDQERLRTAHALDERGQAFLRLKVEGILEAAEIVVAALMPGREKYLLGRRTLPEMDLASVACAIQNIWLAARAEGLGMGWVSLFAPDELAALLQMPSGSKPVAILCIGHVSAFYPRPLLEQENWQQRRLLQDLVFENYWPHSMT